MTGIRYCAISSRRCSTAIPVTNELVGELATAWEWRDERTLRFTLREGVTFHNGDPAHRRGAAFGINYTWSPDNAFDIAQFMGSQITAAAVDELTLDVRPPSLTRSCRPSLLRAAPTCAGRRATRLAADEPIGTGPYQFVEWARGDHISLTAFPDWWGNADPEAALGAQSIKDVEYVWRPESTVRAAQVTAGEAQIGRFLAPEDCATTPVCKEALSVETVPLRLDTVHPTMSDIRVRQAIAHAIDKQSGRPVLRGWRRGHPVGRPVRDRLQRGAGATSLRPRAGDSSWSRGRGRWRAGRHGGRVAVRQGAYLRDEELGEYVANQLNEIGLNATTEVIEHAAYRSSTLCPTTKSRRSRLDRHPRHGNEMMDVGLTASAWYRCDGGVATYCDPELDAMTADPWSPARSGRRPSPRSPRFRSGSR